MGEVRGGLPNRARARGLIAAASSNTPADTHSAARLQERRGAELRRLRRQRYAKRIWALGERVEFELVEKLIRHFALDEDAVDLILNRFAALDPAILRALGGDRIPEPPLRVIGGGR
jgi:hypothetical protein